ncbi:hypothetical protein JOF56_004309 [Kibdelosporangium banguiense]|uniref:DUF4383 domain-containing protein n=1 Tax=Kibdelosporangium banguiense TaxID=1365924 RepID=A0ABS4TI02_9PSEU|nr:DUF4383 domain-containing protein [Kibdelosporangium banguiense]MBP2323924.1 hypothetical protein [Kibdelosporangium banguiense]
MAESVRARVQPTQVLAGLVALAFLTLGIAGFVRTGFSDFAGHGHGMLLGFAINPLHNIVHLLFGVVGVLLAWSSVTARLYGWLLFAGYGVLVIWGLAIVGLTSTNPVSELGNPLNLNIADNWLHLGIAVLGLVVAIVPARRRIVQTEPERTPVEEPITDPVPVQQPVATDRTEPETTTEEQQHKPRGLHRLSSLRNRSAH